jgi:hypothetical protein
VILLDAGFEFFALATTPAEPEECHFPGFLIPMRFQSRAMGESANPSICGTDSFRNLGVWLFVNLI